MAGRLLAAFAVVTAIVLAPTASALPGEGTVLAEEGFVVSGPLRTDISSGGVAWDAPSSLTLDGSAASLRMTLYSYSEVHVANPLTGGFSYWRGEEPRVIEATDAVLVLDAIQPGAQITAYGEALDAQAVLRGASIRGFEERTLSTTPAETTGGDLRGNFYLVLEDVITADSDDVEFHASDAIGLYVWNATVVIDGEPYQTGVSSQSSTSSLPVQNVRETRYVWAVLELDGADLNIAGDHAVVGGATVFEIDGKVRANRADADFTVDRVQRTSAKATFLLDGAVTLVPYRVSAGSTGIASGEPVSADPTLAATVRGDIRDLSAGAAQVRDPRVAAGAAAGGVILLSFLGWALYTRLAKPVLLDNDVRAEIYRIVCASPGIGAREVHRQSGRSWGTVVYHLRQLEKHSLIKSKRFGRLRNFYENHGKWGGQEAMLAVLKGRKTIQIARAIAANPGLHQELLVNATGLPQSTVSYRVKRLREAGLVEERREARFSSYFPTPDLERLLVVRSAMPDEGGDDADEPERPAATATEGTPAS